MHAAVLVDITTCMLVYSLLYSYNILYVSIAMQIAIINCDRRCTGVSLTDMQTREHFAYVYSYKACLS